MPQLNNKLSNLISKLYLMLPAIARSGRVLKPANYKRFQYNFKVKPLENCQGKLDVNDQKNQS